MKRIPTFFMLSLLFVFSANAEVIHTSYGSGLVIAAGSNTPVDFNDDGSIDFYINPNANELSIDPNVYGCYIQSSHNGTRTVRVENSNDPFVDGGDPFNDFETGTVWNPIIGLAPGWEDGQEHIVGFMHWPSIQFAWMKVVPNVADGTLTILESAYESQENTPLEIPEVNVVINNPRPDINFVDLESTVINNPRPDINFVDLEVTTTSVEDVENVLEFMVGPNPAVDYLQLSFQNPSALELDVLVYNSIGRLMYIQEAYDGNLNILVSDWSPGVYFVSLVNGNGILESKKIIISGKR